MEIVNLLPFVIDRLDNIGIAYRGTFAANMWMISDEAFHSVAGTKFSWIASDGEHYVDHRDNFRRPTDEQVIKNITPAVAKIAAALGYLKI